MKTYTSPQIVEYGDVADLTRTVGAFTFKDTYLLSDGTIVINPNGPSPDEASDFGCQDKNKNGTCDADE